MYIQYNVHIKDLYKNDRHYMMPLEASCDLAIMVVSPWYVQTVVYPL